MPAGHAKPHRRSPRDAEAGRHLDRPGELLGSHHAWSDSQSPGLW